MYQITTTLAEVTDSDLESDSEQQSLPLEAHKIEDARALFTPDSEKDNEPKNIIEII